MYRLSVYVLALFAASVFAGTNIDNVRINGNTISTLNTNGDLTLSPNGTGDVRTSAQVGIGGAPNASALFHVTSTSQGAICMPKMTSAQRGSVSSPTEGLEVFNTTDHLPSYYNGSGWLDIASLTGTEVLTNKTISGATNTISNVSLTSGVTGMLPVGNGGTGDATLTAHGVLIGNSTSAIAATSAGSAGQVLQSAGASADPTWSTPTYPSSSGSSGKILRSNGTNNVYSTATYPDSGTDGGILGFTASGTIASSGALTANQLVIGGGAGATPSSLAAGSQYTVLTMGAANPGYGAVALDQSAAVSGTLPIARGGTNNGSLGVTAGGMLYTDGSKIVNVGAGTTGQVLVSQGSSAPQWQTSSAGAGSSTGINLLTSYNWNAELGATTNWTNTGSGTASATNTAANVAFDTWAFSWDAAAADDTFCSTAITVPPGLYGANCGAEFYYSGFDTNISALISDGTNTLVTQALSVQTAFVKSSLSFICPSSGTIKFCLKASANAAVGYLDNVYMGNNPNIGNISQAQFIGSGHFAATGSCDWSKSSATLVAFTANASCPGPTVDSNPGPGTIQTTDADLPKFTVNNLPPGRYRVVFDGVGGASGAGTAFFAINDGTTTDGKGAGNSGSGTTSGVHVEAVFNYTTAGNRTFELFNANSASTTVLYNSSGIYSTYFYIYRFPNTTEQAFKPDLSPSSWSGYHDSTCSLTRTNTAYGDPATDASCGLTERTNRNFGTVTGANSTAQITFTPKRTGMYYVCATASVLGATSGADLAMKLWDGTTTIAEHDWDNPGTSLQVTVPMCGIYNATSTSPVSLSIQTKSSTGAITIQALTGASAIEWSVVAIDQGISAPFLVNSVVNSSTGGTGIEVAKLNCDSSSAITSQLGSWVSSIGNVSNGACAVTLTSGTFSATPFCTATTAQSGGISTGLILNVDATSSTAVSVDCEDDGSTACTAYDFILNCVGAR